MKNLEQSRQALPKNLIRPLPVQDLEDGGFGDLLSRSLVHADTRDGFRLRWRRNSEKEAKL